MITFLFKGLLRDRHRSLFPVIIVALGTMLASLLYSWFMGVFNDMIDATARFDTGHVRIMTRAYQEIETQLPNDLGIFNLDELMSKLEADYPGYDWAPRIKYGGLLDIPDENGETRSQGTVVGFGIDLLGANSREMKRLKIAESIVRGRVPQKIGEIVISEQFANNIDVQIGDLATLISATSNGSMAIQNFTVVGTVHFGMGAMDRGAMIADIRDIQYALDMNNACSELLGFRKDMLFDMEDAERIKLDFNTAFSDKNNEFSPMMLSLPDQRGMGEYLNYIQSAGVIMVFIFVFAMSVVLWNTALMSGIRRYGEVGVRLAIGESKGHVYKTLLTESVMIGILGSVLGTAIGLAMAYYLQEVGLNITGMMSGSSMMLSDVMRARIKPASYYIGFFPGLLATTLGTAIAGIGIFKRQTASLFKELET